jgi:hypothetical protein
MRQAPSVRCTGPARLTDGLGSGWHTADDAVDKVAEANLVRDTTISLVAGHRLLTPWRLPFDDLPVTTTSLVTLALAPGWARPHLDPVERALAEAGAA